METEKLREETEQVQNSSRYYGLRYYTEPVINRRYYYRPPTITIYTNDQKNTITHRPEAPNRRDESVAERATRILQENSRQL